MYEKSKNSTIYTDVASINNTYFVTIFGSYCQYHCHSVFWNLLLYNPSGRLGFQTSTSITSHLRIEENKSIKISFASFLVKIRLNTWSSDGDNMFAHIDNNPTKSSFLDILWLVYHIFFRFSSPNLVFLTEIKFQHTGREYYPNGLPRWTKGVSAER